MPMESAREILLRGLDLQRKGKSAEAGRLYHRVLERSPGQADALNLLGVLALQAKRYHEAADYLRQAVDSCGKAEYINNLGLAYKYAGDIGAAERQFQAALEAEPRQLDAAINLAALWQDAGHVADAYGLLDSFYSQAQRNEQYLYNFAIVCIETGAYARARDLLRQLLAFSPDDVGALFNLGMLLKNAGEFEAAQETFEKLLDDPEKTAKARWYRSQCLLLQGDYTAGWADYPVRFDALDIAYRDSGLPEWSPRAARSSELLVRAEQGVGDEILFATCIPALIPYCGRIHYECDRRLRALLQRTYDRIDFFDRSSGIPTNLAAEYQCNAGDLPRYVDPTLDNPRVGSVMLAVDHERAAAFDLPDNGKLNIGLSYYSNGSNAHRRMPPDEFWGPLLTFADRINLVDLQANSGSSIPPPRNLLDGGALQQIEGIDLYDDLDGLAALISRLDHVISIDNAIAHLAGSLKPPVTLLLSTVHDWRWLAHTSDVPWYPRMRLLRQKNENDWPGLADNLRQRLQQLLTGLD